MSNATGPWCRRNGELCEHNLLDAPHVMRDVRSCIGGDCFTGSAFSTTRPLGVRLIKYGGMEHDFMEIEEGRKIDDSILRMLNEHVEREINHLFLTGEKPATLAQPGALPFGAEFTTSATASREFENLTSDSLEKTIDEVMALFKQPSLVAVWFVDCPAKRVFFDSFMYKAIGALTVEDGKTYQPSIYGVPLYDWDIATSTEDERTQMLKAGRWFCVMPSVWAEMSDGKHRRIEL